MRPKRYPVKLTLYLTEAEAMMLKTMAASAYISRNEWLRRNIRGDWRRWCITHWEVDPVERAKREPLC